MESATIDIIIVPVKLYRFFGQRYHNSRNLFDVVIVT
jgi:hypothetical protein